jgi:hypothetical protein
MALIQGCKRDPSHSLDRRAGGTTAPSVADTLSHCILKDLREYGWPTSFPPSGKVPVLVLVIAIIVTVPARRCPRLQCQRGALICRRAGCDISRGITPDFSTPRGPECLITRFAPYTGMTLGGDRVPLLPVPAPALFNENTGAGPADLLIRRISR